MEKPKLVIGLERSTGDYMAKDPMCFKHLLGGESD